MNALLLTIADVLRGYNSVISSQNHVIYVTFDGLLEALGETQVLRLVEHLNRDPQFRFTILSLEKSRELEDETRLNRLRDRLADQNIGWLWLPYERGARGIMANCARVIARLGEVVESEGCAILHARSYLAAMVCDPIGLSYGIPILFDFRGYWIDERIEEKRWFTNPIMIAAGRRLERHLFQRASAIVSLAQPAADDIANGRFGDLSNTPVYVIPTCVDDDRFNLKLRDNPRPPELRGKNVIGYVGSLNASYKVEESLALTRKILEQDETAFFLGLSGQVELLKELAIRHGIPEDRMLIRSVRHEDMPQWMAWIDWGLLMLHTNFAKRGSMPTKLGEFLASGVRPIYEGCNDDVANWVKRAGTGLLAFNLDELGHSKITTDKGWENVRAHFSLMSAHLRYLEIFRKMLEKGQA